MVLFPTFLFSFSDSNFKLMLYRVGVFRAVDKMHASFIEHFAHWQVQASYDLSICFSFDFIVIVCVTRCIFGHLNGRSRIYMSSNIYYVYEVHYYAIWWQNTLSNDDHTLINKLYKCKINALFFINSIENDDEMKATTKTTKKKILWQENTFLFANFWTFFSLSFDINVVYYVLFLLSIVLNN